MSTYRLNSRALSEIDQIADYTLANWGGGQADRYVAALFDRFEWLANNPMLGRARDELGLGIRSFQQGAHIVLYTVSAEEIIVVGIPHGSADLPDYFET